MELTPQGWLYVNIGGVVSLRCSAFRQQLERLAEAEEDVLIDLTSVEAIESAAVGALMRVRTKREQSGRRCWFAAQLPGLRRILHTANATFAADSVAVGCD